MSMKNFNDTIGNRSRDLPVCSAVPQPPRHRVLLLTTIVSILKQYQSNTTIINDKLATNTAINETSSGQFCSNFSYLNKTGLKMAQ
jgi:hypothetical protein